MNDLPVGVDQLDDVARLKVRLDLVGGEVAEVSAVEHARLVGQPLLDAHVRRMAAYEGHLPGVERVLRTSPMSVV